MVNGDGTIFLWFTPRYNIEVIIDADGFINSVIVGNRCDLMIECGITCGIGVSEPKFTDKKAHR